MTVHLRRPAARIAQIPALTILVSAAVAWPSSAGAAVAVNPGTYTARAGMASFSFKLENYTPTDHCGTQTSARCFIALTYPKIKAKCGNGQVEDNPFPVSNGFVTAAGRFSYFQKLTSNSPFISFIAHVKGSTVTGTLRERDTFDDGNGNVTCDTGVVHWTAHRR